MAFREEKLFREGLRRASKEPKLRLEKTEDQRMPIFSRDVQFSSTQHERGGTVTVKYAWKEHEKPSEVDAIKVDYAVFRKGERLEGLSKISLRDGFDRFVWRYKSVTYFLRKTSEDVARALYNAAKIIRGAVETVVGYLKTVLGNFYVISSIEPGSWVFDEKLINRDVRLADVLKFDAKHKERLVELVVEKLVGLHKQRLVLGKFGLESLLLTTRELMFTDLRKLRISRKSSFFVEEFISAMRYLLSAGIARKGDIVHAGMIYAIEMKDACNCWYLEKNRRRVADEIELVSELEGATLQREN